MSSTIIEFRFRSTLAALYQRAVKLLAPASVNLEIANECAKETRNHFRVLDALRPNRIGGKRTNFWGKYVKNITPRGESDRAVVSIDDPNTSASGKSPLLLHYYGGTVTPTRSKFLTVPAVPEAHGVRARESVWAGQLHFSLVAGKYPALVLREALGTGKKAARLYAGRVIYWLRRSVTIRPDHSVLPNPEILAEAGLRALTRTIKRLETRGGVA